ncbi:MAG: glutaminyl-peptide cyclotransferase [Flavobacteriaceae bacterium]|nr:glutaminyl-peptide cyclotransferase [Flavobacteriaceae bacterium]
MKTHNFLNTRVILLLIAVIFVNMSCETKYKFKLESPKKAVLGSEINISLSEANNIDFDRVIFYLDGKKQDNKGESSFKMSLKGCKLGKQVITAVVFYEKKSKKIRNDITILSDESPEIYDFKIINSYKHNKKSYTQGLEFYDNELYETTGLRGKSSLNKVDLKTGEILKKIEFDKNIFAEGMTIFNNNIHILTWQSGKGFVYSIDDFKKQKEFKYSKSKEGWGLTHNEEFLIKSDGTEKIWFLDPETHKEVKYIEVYTNKTKVSELNELEYIDGMIYANKYKKNTILIINPKNGKLEAMVDMTRLWKEIRKGQSLDSEDEVLNGIAYNKQTGKLYVTGKRWGKIFEIELIKNN